MSITPLKHVWITEEIAQGLLTREWVKWEPNRWPLDGYYDPQNNEYYAEHSNTEGDITEILTERDYFAERYPRATYPAVLHDVGRDYVKIDADYILDDVQQDYATDDGECEIAAEDELIAFIKAWNDKQEGYVCEEGKETLYILDLEAFVAMMHRRYTDTDMPALPRGFWPAFREKEERYRARIRAQSGTSAP